MKPLGKCHLKAYRLFFLCRVLFTETAIRAMQPATSLFFYQPVPKHFSFFHFGSRPLPVLSICVYINFEMDFSCWGPKQGATKKIKIVEKNQQTENKNGVDQRRKLERKKWRAETSGPDCSNKRQLEIVLHEARGRRRRRWGNCINNATKAPGQTPIES